MLTELIGILGGIFFLIAFTEAAAGRWNGKSFYYELFNLLGAVFLLYYAFSKDAYTNIVLNLIWGVVALYGINNIIERHKVRKVNRKKRKKTRA